MVATLFHHLIIQTNLALDVTMHWHGYRQVMNACGVEWHAWEMLMVQMNLTFLTALIKLNWKTIV
jgi:hypothetical protein